MFYCQKVCGDDSFSIKEWDDALKYCNDAGIEGVEREKILHPESFLEKNYFEVEDLFTYFIQNIYNQS